MRFAVLCPGPSLPRFWGAVRHEAWDLVVAVNSAGWIYDCDWLVFADRGIKKPIEDGEADPPRVGYVTHPRTPLPTRAERSELPIRNERCRYRELLPRGEDGISCAYTFPNALAFAHRIVPNAPALEVHVYGFDCDPAPHGVALEGGNHKLSRWVSELPWIKHCWDDRTHVHSDLPQPVRRWLELGESATRTDYEQAIECLRVRCEAATARGRAEHYPCHPDV